MHETRCFFNYDNADPEPLNPLNKTGVYGAMRRYYHASETFLWHEKRADNGKLVRLRQIEISYDRMTDGVRGLRCTYDTDFKKEFGILTGDTYILDLNHRPNEKVTLLVTRRIADGNYGIEVRFRLFALMRYL
jgi:glycosyltransferase involved in cell wall biosynthesis